MHHYYYRHTYHYYCCRPYLRTTDRCHWPGDTLARSHAAGSHGWSRIGIGSIGIGRGFDIDASDTELRNSISYDDLVVRHKLSARSIPVINTFPEHRDLLPQRKQVRGRFEGV